jgi:hypothetical protein
MARAPHSAPERQRLLAAFHRSDLSQQQFCSLLRASGIELAPRTLRGWQRDARHNTDGVGAAALRQAVALLRNAAGILEAALDEAPGAYPSEAAAAVPDVAALAQEPEPTVTAEEDERPPVLDTRQPTSRAPMSGTRQVAASPAEPSATVSSRPVLATRTRFSWDIGDLVDD